MSAALTIRVALMLKRNWKPILAAIVGALFLLAIVVYLAFGNAQERENSIEVGKADVNEEVEALRPLFEKYAKQYGIPNQVDILMAKTMQESGGKVKDVMQSSESVGLPMNTLGTEESIKQGTKYFAQVLDQAGGDVKLALQSYNFGSGFINYAKEHNGGEYSKELAVQFSQKKYQELKSTGLYSCVRPEYTDEGACYGDVEYVDAVMKYISDPVDAGNYGNLIAQGEKWIGNSDYVFGGGRTKNDQKNGIFDCSSFVYWLYAKQGKELGNLASVNTDSLKTKGEDVDYSNVQEGDLVFFDTYKPDGHVGVYVGDGKFIGAQSSTGVAIESMEDGYWGDNFNGRVKRIQT